MKKIIGVGLLALVLVGCQKSSGPRGGSGVVDFDRVASSLGWIEQLNKNLQATDAEMRGRLEQVLRGNLKAIEDAKTAVATAANLTADQIKVLNSVQDLRELSQLPLSKEQKEQLAGVVNQVNANWQQAQTGYQQALQQRRTALVVEYREKIRPYVRRVAVERGITIVFTSTENVVYVDPHAADLTDAVVDLLLKAPADVRGSAPTPTPVPTPAK